MTPKEKAIELYEKYFYELPVSSEEEYDEAAYTCAMICVNEILDILYDFNDINTSKYNYWLDVRKELKSLK